MRSLIGAINCVSSAQRERDQYAAREGCGAARNARALISPFSRASSSFTSFVEILRGRGSVRRQGACSRRPLRGSDRYFLKLRFMTRARQTRVTHAQESKCVRACFFHFIQPDAHRPGGSCGTLIKKMQAALCKGIHTHAAHDTRSLSAPPLP